MSDTYIPITPGSGAKVRTIEQTVGGNVVDAEVVVPSNANGDLYGHNSATLYDGQNASVTTTAAALASSQAVSELIVQADPGNTANVLLGNATSQHWVLAPGAAMGVPATNLNLVYVKSASGTQTVNYLGRS